MINNNVEPKHLGSGVVLFESAIDLDWDYVREFSRDAINKEKEDMYTPTVNPETGDEIYLNKSGYFFQKESVFFLSEKIQFLRTTKPARGKNSQNNS